MKIIILALCIIIGGCGAFVDNNDAIEAMEAQGFSDVVILSKSILFVSFRGCTDQDAAVYSMRATNTFGKSVDVIVCVGWPFKGATIRY